MTVALEINVAEVILAGGFIIAALMLLRFIMKGRPKFVTEKTHQAADRIEADAATITELRQRVTELEGERDSYKAALEGIAEFGHSHPGYGFSCAKAARTALERRGSE